MAAGGAKTLANSPQPNNPTAAVPCDSSPLKPACPGSVGLALQIDSYTISHNIHVPRQTNTTDPETTYNAPPVRAQDNRLEQDDVVVAVVVAVVAVVAVAVVVAAFCKRPWEAIIPKLPNANDDKELLRGDSGYK